MKNMIMLSGNRQNRPRIALTMGDPCGVGPDIIVKAFSSGELFNRCSPVVIGDPLALERAIRLLRSDLKIRALNEPGSALKEPESASKELRSALNGLESIAEPSSPGILHVFSPLKLTISDLEYGRPTENTCRAVVEYIQTAVELAREGLVHAVCTCPINKANLHRAGFSFPGHTEFLQHLTRTESVVMMLAGPRLRVALVTIHEPIADIPVLLTHEKIHRTLRITADALIKDFGLGSARIGVAGLNPHAGEAGRFGREEIDIIEPAVKSFNMSGCEVSGPYPPDTLFHRAYGGEFDAVVAMYHDQGLIPIKLVHFHDAVNVTLGLPIVRTSPDHGTAYDLAGTGKADSGSLRAAVVLAAEMALNRSRPVQQELGYGSDRHTRGSPA